MSKRLDAIRQRWGGVRIAHDCRELFYKASADVDYLLSLAEKQREALKGCVEYLEKYHAMSKVYADGIMAMKKGQQALKCDEGGEG